MILLECDFQRGPRELVSLLAPPESVPPCSGDRRRFALTGGCIFVILAEASLRQPLSLLLCKEVAHGATLSRSLT